MSRWLSVGLSVLMVANAAVAAAPRRTDGPEGSEYGAGGYWRYRTGGQVFVEGYFGAASVSSKADDDAGEDFDQTDLLSGFYLGYMVEDWLSFQVGYGHIHDQNSGLLSAGMRSMYRMDPFNYFVSLSAILFSDDNDTRFGLSPGAGAEMMLSDRLTVGLSYKYDIVLADQRTNINRFSAHIRLGLGRH